MDIKIKKKLILEGIVERVDYPNLGQVPIGNEYITVKNSMPGQKIRFVINKFKKGKAEGRILEVLQQSPLEIREPSCSIFPSCGGCMYQTMEYETQREMKEQQVKRLLDPVISYEYFFEGIKASPAEFRYRNKMEFSFGDAQKDGPLTLGLHKRGSTYDVLTASDCVLVHEDFTKILSAVLSFFKDDADGEYSYYHKMSHEGFLRHLLIRRGDATGELLVNLVTSSQGQFDEEAFVQMLLSIDIEGTIVGILHIINDSLSDVVKSDETCLLYGQDYLIDRLFDLEFIVTPFSFFQPNSKGAEVLYTIVQDYIGDIKQSIVYDLFSGTGTIAQVLAGVSKKVIGVEIVQEAVTAAKENAATNGLSNCEFHAGDVFQVLDEITELPDVIVLDPPRDGIHPKALPKILAYGVDRIIYVSCKASSFARDLEKFHEAGYRVQRVSGVDQFSQTVHVEVVAMLARD